MKRIRSGLGAAALALILGSCAPGPVDTSKDQAAIRAVFDRYVATLESKDGAGWAGLWDKDGVQLPPDAPMVAWSAESLAQVAEEVKAGTDVFAMEIETQEVLVFPADGYGIARGVYTWTSTPADGKNPIDYDGKFMTLLKKQADGRWLIFRDSFNSNRPPE